MAGGEVVLVDLVKRFADVTAVAGINLDMPPGEFQILLDGVDMAQTPPHKRNVNTVFQNYALFPHLSVADNVAFGLKYQNVSKQDSKKRVAEALELVRLTGFARRRPSQLSGGQQQRVALARALVLNP